MRDVVVGDGARHEGNSSAPSPKSSSASSGRYEWEPKMQEAPLEILRIVEEQRKRESQTWRKMESRGSELKETLLRKEKEKVHQLLGDMDGLKKELEKIKIDNSMLQESNILQKRRINEYEEERVSLQKDREHKLKLEVDLQSMLTTLKVVNNDNEMLKSTLDREMMKHISQLKQYQAALSIFEKLKLERSKFQDISKQAEKRCRKAVTLNLLQKLRIFMIRLERSKMLWGMHKWILFCQSNHLHHVCTHKVHQVTHKLKHEHQKAMQQVKEKYEKSIMDQTKLHDRAIVEREQSIQKIEKSRSLATRKYFSDVKKKYYFNWMKACFISQRDKVEKSRKMHRIFAARVLLTWSRWWTRLMLRKSFALWIVVCLSYRIGNCHELQDKNVEIEKKMRKLEAGYYKRLSQTVVMMTSRRALKMRTFYRWHRIFFESIALKGVFDDTRSMTSNQSHRSTPQHGRQKHRLEQKLPSSSHDIQLQQHGHIHDGGDNFREEMRKKLSINTNISPTFCQRSYLSSPPSSTTSIDGKHHMGKKAWSPSGNNVRHGPYRLDNGGNSSRQPSPRSSKGSPSATTPLSHRFTPSPRAQSRI